MLRLGYKLMSEEHGPKELVRNAVGAEKAGFDFAAISDHFFPWIEEQGHAPLAWSVLGAIAIATDRLDLMTAVTCPTIRYHPAIIAQGAATLALLTDGRFTLGLGSGERLNEHVVGLGWPGIVERHERLAEAVDIIQGLMKGELTNYRGKHLQIDNAKLYDRPDKKPPVVIAAGGPKAAGLAGEKGDGLVATEQRKNSSRLTAQPVERDRAMPKSECAARKARKTRARRPTSTSAGRLPVGQCRRSCPIPKGSKPRASMSPLRTSPIRLPAGQA
jgi:G6PDH family F420-dependent oxidoreductase